MGREYEPEQTTGAVSLFCALYISSLFSNRFGCVFDRLDPAMYNDIMRTNPPCSFLTWPRLTPRPIIVRGSATSDEMPAEKASFTRHPIPEGQGMLV